MNWYVVDSDTLDPIAGPYKTEKSAHNDFRSKLTDQDWLSEHGVEEGSSWWMSGWKVLPAWWATPTDNPERNPETSWTIRTVRFDVSIFVEQYEGKYLVGLCDESTVTKEVTTIAECNNFGEVMAEVIQLAVNHEKFHDQQACSVSVENVGVGGRLAEA